MKTYDPKKTDSEVRQASSRKMNFRVLIISLIGVLLAFSVLYLVYNHGLPTPAS